MYWTSLNLEVLGHAKYSSEIKTLQHLISLNELYYLAGKRGQAKLKDLISIKKIYSERSRCKEYWASPLTEIKKELPLIILG